MAPSFISMLMAHHPTDKRSRIESSTTTTRRSIASITDPPSGVTLPHLIQSTSSRTEGLDFRPRLPDFQHPPFGQHPSSKVTAAATSSSIPSPYWNDRQKVQDFFQHTQQLDEDHHSLQDTKIVQSNDKIIDVRELITTNKTTKTRRGSSETSSTSSEENQQEEDEEDVVLRGAITGKGRLQSALEDLLARQEEEEEEEELDHEALVLRKKERRRYDSFDIMADVRLTDDDSSDNPLDSLYSTPARSRKNSEDYFGVGLLEVLSQRHMPVGIDRHASVADMLLNRKLPTPNEDSDDEEDYQQEQKVTGVSARKVDRTDTRRTDTDPSTMDRRNMLAMALAKQALPFTETTCLNKFTANSYNALEATMTERSSPLVSNKESTENLKGNPLETMLAGRNAQDKVSGAAHPLTAISELRHQEAEASTDAVKDETPLKNHPTYQKYFKMLAVGLPASVVKHKMQSDSVDPAILDMDPDKPLPEAPVPALDEETEVAYQAQLKEYTAKHGKYLQMVKVGLPFAVVEHKMRMDGVDPAWLQGPPKRPKPKAVAAADVSDEERAAHRKKYRKYFQMLRMGLPRGAVEQKMRLAGLDPAELNGPRQVAAPAQPVQKSLKRKDSIRKKLHWEGKKNGTRRDSLWGDNVEEAKEQVQISEESRAMLEKLFVKDLSESKKRNASAKSEGAAVVKKKKAMIQLIDMKKSQNIAITLARVKLTYSELKREILVMNSTVLSPSQVRSLMDMWPDRKEMEAILAFKGDMGTIGSAEQFLVEVRNVPRFQEKLACLVFKQEFPSRVHELRESLDLVTRGVYQVCSSAELRQVFIYILQIGNLLNFGGDDDQQGVDAFSLGSLVRFSQTKAFVGGITFLQYVVQSIERDVPHLAHFYKDIDLISKCSKVAYSSLASEKNALEAGLQKVMREAHASMSDTTADDADKEAMAAFHDTLIEFCKDVDALQDLLDKLNAAKAHFLKYFEEEDTEEELDVLLLHIANFTSEYRREHSTYVAKMKKDSAS